MHLPYFRVSAFTRNPFAGNPAGVCILDAPLPDATLQAIAHENNLSETAFLLPEPNGFNLRWMTPTVEVDLCGHATLAAAHVLFHHRGCQQPDLRFSTRSGLLTVRLAGNRIELNFPSRPPTPCEPPATLRDGLRLKAGTPFELLRSRDLMVVLESEAAVRAIQPDFPLLADLDALGVIVTARGSSCDFVSRFFAPRAGIDEDPVTGSTHCTLAPYWAAKLGKSQLDAEQVSPRGGTLQCELSGDRVLLRGDAVTYQAGTISIP